MPEDTFVVEVPVPPGEVEARLAARVQKVRWYRYLRSNNDEVQGHVGSGEFTLEVVPYRSNSIFVTARGRLESTESGTRLSCRLAPTRVMHGLFAFLVLLALGFTIFAIARQAMFDTAAALWIGPPFLWVLIQLGFATDTEQIKQAIRDAISAESLK